MSLTNKVKLPFPVTEFITSENCRTNKSNFKKQKEHPNIQIPIAGISHFEKSALKENCNRTGMSAQTCFFLQKVPLTTLVWILTQLQNFWRILLQNLDYNWYLKWIHNMLCDNNVNTYQCLKTNRLVTLPRVIFCLAYLSFTDFPSSCDPLLVF